MKDLTKSVKRVYLETRHSTKSDKDYQVLIVEFVNGYKYEEFRLSNDTLYILGTLAQPAGN